MKSSLCVLPLQHCMIYCVDEKGGREENHLPRIEPIIGRDGWYYDRKRPAGEREWFEYRGQAFITYGGTGEQFRYELMLANAHIMSDREREAYQEMLRLGVPKVLRKMLMEALDIDKQVWQLRDIRLSGLRAKKRFK